MTNGETALFEVGIHPSGVMAQRVVGFIDFWTSSDLEFDAAFLRYCRKNEIEVKTLIVDIIAIKQKAISNNEVLEHLFKPMTYVEFITVLAHMSVNHCVAAQ